MRGIVEIYSNNKLILQSPNLIVDGASEIITDIFSKVTTGIRDNTILSSILDASNYTIQALSFGKDAAGYATNLHASGNWQISSGEYQPRFTVVGTPYYYADHTATAVDVFNKTVGLPSFPNPIDRKLEPGEFNSFGHNINAIQFSATLGLTAAEAMLSGCYAPSEGIDVALSASNGIASGIVGTNHKSEYNLSGSMDLNGFINIINDTNPLGQFIMSATTTASSTGEVSYLTTMNAFDLNLLELYGGIYHIGLWALDLDQTLQVSGLPPYTNNLSNPIKRFKLFAKKTLSKSLTFKDGYAVANTGSNPERDLAIIWRIKF